MNFISKDIARYCGYRDVYAFQNDQRRYGWPLKPIKRIRGKYRFSYGSCLMALVIDRLRASGIPSSMVKPMIDRIDDEAFRLAVDEFESGAADEIIVTLPVSEMFEPDEVTAVVHTSKASAYETLDLLDCVYVRLTDLAEGIREGAI